MNRKLKIGIILVLTLGIAGLAIISALYLGSHNIAVLNPKGTIAGQQRHLMWIATLLMLVVVLPVFALTFGIAWRYRAGNKKAVYQPDWDHSRTIEAVWWLVPFLIIAILAGITWASSHDLDPYKSLQSAKKPLKIQVVALQWKWLFIYPEHHVATVNYLPLPARTPIDFDITADAPMNSFWIPQLGGQMYAMPGMNSQLHLLANEPGDYAGLSANISGAGFAGMKFTARVTDEVTFDRWLQTLQQSPEDLSYDSYTKLAKPSADMPPASYSIKDTTLYDTVMMKYMSPGAH